MKSQATGGLLMTIDTKIRDRRSAVLAAAIGTVLASYAGGAAALEFELENGATINWNTTLSAGASFRAEEPSRRLYTRADGSLIGLYTSPLIPGTAVGPKDGLAGNHAAGDGNLNYDKGDRYTTPFKLITDVEFKKGGFGALVRVKAWYDQALSDEEVRVGSQANNYNGVRPGLGPVPGYGPCTAATPAGAPCLVMSPAGQNLWPTAKLSDDGFEDEQKFSNVMLLDAYAYGSFTLGESELQLRLGNQVINWGESVFIQGVNQINPIDVPAARRAGAELKEILLPVWAAYANWGFNWGSVEAFYQLEWQNTSVDGCGTYFTQTSTLISADPGSCDSITVVGGQLGNLAPGTSSPTIPQLGSQVFLQANGTYVPATQGNEARDSGQLGIAFRVPVDKIDTELGFYAMRIHSRLPYSSGVSGTNPNDIPEPLPLRAARAGPDRQRRVRSLLEAADFGNPLSQPDADPRAGLRGHPRRPGQPDAEQGILGVPGGHPDLRRERGDQHLQHVRLGRTELVEGRAGAGQRQRPDRRLDPRHRTVSRSDRGRGSRA